jgi:hypothetical protein
MAGEGVGITGPDVARDLARRIIVEGRAEVVRRSAEVVGQRRQPRDRIVGVRLLICLLLDIVGNRQPILSCRKGVAFCEPSASDQQSSAKKESRARAIPERG